MAVFLLLLLLCAAQVPSCAADPCIIEDARLEYMLGPRLEYLEDPAGRLEPAELLAPAYSRSFASLGENTFNFGYSKSTFWFKGRLLNKTGKELRGILSLREPAIESVDLFSHGETRRSGVLVPVTRRDVPGRGSLFRLVLPADSDETILIRVRTDTGINLTFRFFEETRYWEYDRMAAFAASLCFGALLFAILYNIFIFLSLRDKAYLFYVLLVAGILANRFIVLGWFQYALFPDAGRWNYYSILLATSALTACMLLFNTSFLSTKTRMPLLHKLHAGLLACVAVNVSILCFDAQLADKLTIVLMITTGLLSVLTGALACRRAYPPARYYLLAWVVPIALAVLLGLGLFKLVAFTQYTDEGALVGTVIMAVLMSQALGDRFSAIKREKECAQAQALEAQRLLNEELEKQVGERTSLLEKANCELKRLSTTDRLTGVFNRLKLDDDLDALVHRAVRYGQAFSIILLDIDLFKAVNDNFGHLAGDTVLKELARILTANTRNTDTVGRWGGEEFMILCGETSGEGTRATAEKLRSKIEAHAFSGIDRLTCSFGTADFEPGLRKEDVILRADQALYRAKNRGRNRVEGPA